MFGYVRIFKPDLTFREYEQYRGVYCTLCRTLGRRYGLISRMTLSYDFAFLALFGMALDERTIRFSKGHCSFCPTKKCAYCTGDGAEAIDYAADVAVLLAYYKLEDTIHDERGLRRFGARALKLFLKRDFCRAEKRRPKESLAARAYMEQQRDVENASDTVSIDAAAHPTAQFLADIASHYACDESSKEAVERFGYCLGRFIYLADAAEDVDEDAKTGAFNPLLTKCSPCFGAPIEEKQKYAAQTLHASVAVCAESYELLNVRRFNGIIRNVLYRGLPSVIDRIQNTKYKGDCHEKPV